MAWDAEAVANGVIGGFFVLVATGLFAIGAGNRANRIYSLVVFLYGIEALGIMWEHLLGPGTTAGATALRIAAYATFAAPIFVLYFCLAYPSRPAWLPPWLARPHIYVATVVAVDAAWAARLIAPEGVVIASLITLRELVVGLGAILFIQRALATTNPVAQRSWLLLALGGAAFNVFNGTDGLINAIYEDRFWSAAAAGGWEDVLQLAFAAASIALLWTPAFRKQPPVPVARACVVTILVAGMCGAVASGPVTGTVEGPVYIAFAVVWILLSPLTVVYAILRHQVFDIDLRFRWTVTRGALLVPLVAVFFVAAQVAEGFAERYFGGQGWILGAIAAGIVLVFLAPVQRALDRLTTKAAPATRSLDFMTSRERAVFYQQQFMFALSDGKVSRDEKRMLEFARRRLGLTPAEARRLEADAAGMAS